MKKGISLLVAIMLVIAMVGVTPALAYTEYGDWQTTGTSSDADYSDVVEDASVARGGENYLKLVNTSITNGVKATAPVITGLTDGETYTVSFYVRGTCGTNMLKTGFEGLSEFSNSGSGNTNYAYKTGNIAYTGDGTATLYFDVKARRLGPNLTNADLAIDDIIIRDSSSEIVWECDFELPPIVGGAPDEIVTNVLMDDRVADTLVIGFINAERAGIEKVAIYDYDTGDILADSDRGEIGTDADTAQEVRIPYTKGETLRFKIVTTYPDSVTEYIGSTDFKSYHLTLGQMASGVEFMTKFPKASQWHYGDAHPIMLEDGNIAYKSYSVGLVEQANHFVGVSFARELMDANKTYKFSFMVKGKRIQAGPQFDNDLWATWISSTNEQYPGDPGTINQLNNTSEDFHEIWFKLDNLAERSGAGPRFFHNHRNDEFIIDDIMIYELDEEGNPVGENLSKVGDVDSVVKSTSRSDVKNLEATVGSRKVELNWELPMANCYGINVYQVVRGEKFLKARLGATETSIVLDNLTNDIDYEFVVCAINGAGLDSEGVKANVTPVADPLDITEIVLKADGAETLSVNASGTYTAEVTVSNYTTETRPVELFMIYTVDGAIKAADFADALLIENDSAPLTCSINIDLGVDEEGNPVTDVENDALKVFLWDSIDGMTSLVPMLSFN